ncbi:unnamed protein product [Bursaphelenchus xylophilus]|uniref:(pine wood nematode) hypothetical protein n=1 Tax=Bursaphelenchus xylophilus TaxID=6326 RepID=A0A1I7SUQ3_BURXY|nr:unnamed protein product [Bursaphelenchus xylophilus]CAG9125956.1 unnamed protein product [Bursaphelenchus xylophilus]
MAFDDYKCCCNTHVHSAILAIAIIGWLLGVGALIVIIVSFAIFFVPIPLLAGVGNLMLLIGRCTNTACLYWFFFVTQTLLIADSIWFCVELYRMAKQTMAGEYYSLFGWTLLFVEEMGGFFIVFVCFGVLYVLLNTYFTYIAYKAYRYTVNVLNTHVHHVDAVMVSTHQTAYPPASANPGFAPYPQAAPAHSFSSPAGVPGRGFQVPPSVYPEIKSDNARGHM